MTQHGWVVNATKEEAEQMYMNNLFVYNLSDAHSLLVQVLGVVLRGGVVMCRIKPMDILKVYNKAKDKTNYEAMNGELVLAGRLITA